MSTKTDAAIQSNGIVIRKMHGMIKKRDFRFLKRKTIRYSMINMNIKDKSNAEKIKTFSALKIIPWNLFAESEILKLNKICTQAETLQAVLEKFSAQSKVLRFLL